MSLPPLSPDQRIKPRSFDLRLCLLYAAIYVPMGIHLPYFPLWLDATGFGSREIALILSIPLFLRVVTTPVILAMADGAEDRVNVLVLLVAATLAISLGYLTSPVFALTLAVSLALQIVWSPQSPLVDSLALSGVRRFGSDFSRMRIWGSISFLCANLAGGWAIAAAGGDVVPVLLTAGFALSLAAALAAPRIGRPRRASPLSAADLAKAGAVLKQPYFLLAVAAAGLANASHGLLYAFGTIHWSRLGIGDATIGFLWAVAVVAEVLLFLVFKPLFGAVRPGRLLQVAALAAIVRWCAFPFIWDAGAGVPGFVAAQALHAFSTGLAMLGVQGMIAETVPEERTGAAQGVVFFANALGIAATVLVSGPLWAAFGSNGYLAMTLVAGAGLVAALAATRLQPQSAGSGG